MRRLKRSKNYEIVLQIKNEDFIRPPRDNQRNWLVNQALTEFALNLDQLNDLARRFVPGREADHVPDRTQADLSDEQIMEDWQVPLMETMAKAVTERHGSVLEIGFGRGVSATFIQACGVASHTIVECNDAVVDRFHAWKQTYPDSDICLLHGLWQEVMDQFDLYDGIFFHTYPLTQEEYLEQVVNSVTFAAHFFPVAAAHLKPGGIFTYFTHEIDSFSRAHQRLLFDYFQEISLSRVELALPPDLADAWWADSMVVVKAKK